MNWNSNFLNTVSLMRQPRLNWLMPAFNKANSQRVGSPPHGEVSTWEDTNLDFVVAVELKDFRLLLLTPHLPKTVYKLIFLTPRGHGTLIYPKTLEGSSCMSLYA